MTLITISKKTFEKEIGKLDEKMQEKIALFGTPVEGISDDELQIEVFPNRPDLISYQGFRRSFLAFLGKKIGLKQYPLNKQEKDYSVFIESSVKDIRPYIVCAIVKGLKLDDEKIKELIEIQEKLHFTVGRKRKKVAIGIYPLEKIKLPITYKALEPDQIKFTPLESGKEMSGLQILQHHPIGKDYAHLLAGKAKFPIFIDAEKNILSMPPIINSQLTGKVTEKTKDVFVECSGWDFEIQEKVLNILVTSLAEMGGKIYQMEFKGAKKSVTPDLKAEKMKISVDNTNKLLGTNLTENALKKLLERMGHNYSKGEVEIASWRIDILHEVDLIEDVAIAYGYENFIPIIPTIATIGEENPNEATKKCVAQIIAGLGILEVSNYHLTTKKEQFTKMGVAEKKETDFVQIEGSKTDYDILRKDLTHYLLKNLSENIDSDYPQKIFEIGKVIKANKNEIVEEETLAVAISPGNFTEIKQVLEYLFRMIGLKLELNEPENFPQHFIDGRVAEILIADNEDNNNIKDVNNKIREDKPFIRWGRAISRVASTNSEVVSRTGKLGGARTAKNIGFIGEIHPKILKNWRIKMPVAILEIKLGEIFKELG